MIFIENMKNISYILYLHKEIISYSLELNISEDMDAINEMNIFQLKILSLNSNKYLKLSYIRRLSRTANKYTVFWGHIQGLGPLID